jgi:hypothetical protein
LVKYGNDFPATMITGKETFMKRAVRNPHYKGHKVGISDNGKTAWAEVYKDNLEFPIRVEVDYVEYVGMKGDKPNKMWGSKPKTMLKKVALVQALRESFPEEFGGLYSPEEVHNVDEDALPTDEVIIDANAKVSSHSEEGIKQAESISESSAPAEKKPPPQDESTSGIPEEKDEKPADTPKEEKETDQAFIKILKVTKKKTTNNKIQFFIFSVGETMYSTFSEKIAQIADKIKGKDHEVLVLYDIVHLGDKTYYNISHGEPEEVFVVQP